MISALNPYFEGREEGGWRMVGGKGQVKPHQTEWQCDVMVRQSYLKPDITLYFVYCTYIIYTTPNPNFTSHLSVNSKVSMSTAYMLYLWRVGGLLYLN